MNKHLICLGLFWVAGIVGCGDRQSASPTVARATGTQQSNAEETEAMSGDSSLDASSTDSIPRSSGDPSGSVNQPTTTTRKERPVPEQEAIDAIRKLNGKVQYADASPTAPVTKVSFGGVRGADLGMLKDLATIEELDLGGGQSSVVDITFIAPLAKLKTLDLPCITPDQFDILADLPSLETLTVGIAKPSLASAGIDNPYKNREATKEFNNQDFLKQAIDRLSKSQSLKHLRLLAQNSGQGVAQPTTFSSSNRLPRLTFLDLSHLTLSDDNCADLGRCMNLNTLVLTNWNGKAFTEKGIQQLSECKNLKRLSVKGASDSILSVAVSFPPLTHLDFPVSRLSDAQLVSARRSNPRLTLSERPPHPKWWGDWLAVSSNR